MTTSSTSSRLRRRLLATAAVVAMGVFAATAVPGLAAVAPTRPFAYTPNKNDPPGLNDMMLKAHQALQQGHPSVAVLYLKNAAQLAPKNAGVRTELGLALLQSGNAEASERELRAAKDDGAPPAQLLPILYDAMLLRGESQMLLDQFPAPADNDKSQLASATLRARAVALVQTGKKDEAAASMDKALAISRDPINLVTRARLYNEMGDRPSALKMTDEALAKSPNDATALELKASLLQLDNKASDALQYADRLVKAHPSYAMGYIARAGVYFQLKQDAKAVGDANAALALVPNMPQALYFKALARARAHDPKGAWNIAQVLPPEFVRSRADIGIVVSQMATEAGHPELSTSILSSLLNLFPNNDETRIRLATQYLQLKDAQRAVDTLSPMKDSGDPRAMVLLGQAYAMLHQYANSTDYFEKAITNGYGGDLLKQQVAGSNLRYGNLDAAVKEYQDLYAKNPGDAQLAGPLIAALLRKNDMPGAIAVADKLAAAAPKSPYGPLFQGQLLMNKGDVAGAITVLTRAVNIDHKFVPAIYDRAVCYIARGDLKSANADLQTIIAADPKNVLALIRAAQIAMRMGQQDKVVPLLNKAAAIDPKNSVPQLALAAYYLSHNNAKQASTIVSNYLLLVPDNPTARAFQGEIQLTTGAVDQAIGTFQGLAKRFPDSAQVQVMLGNALATKKDVAGALTAYQHAVQLAPKLKLARATLIRYALANKNETLALQVAKDGVAQDPGPESDLQLASVYATVKQTDKAVAELKHSIAQHPSEATVGALSELLRKQGDDKQANAVLTGWIAKNPNDVGMRLIYAQAMMNTAPTVAEQQFRAVLKLQPNNTAALNNLSWILQNKDPKQAVSYAEQALKLAPNSPEVLDTVGWVKWQAKDGPGALPYLQKAYAADAKNAEIGYHLAVVLDGTGHRPEAKKTIDAILASKADFDDLQKAKALSAQWR